MADAAEHLAAGKPHRSHQQHSYLSRSRYEHQLARFQERFQPEQLLILRSEQLFANPSDGWILVLQFWELMSFPAHRWIRCIPVLERLRMYLRN